MSCNICVQCNQRPLPNSECTTCKMMAQCNPRTQPNVQHLGTLNPSRNQESGWCHKHPLSHLFSPHLFFDLIPVITQILRTAACGPNSPQATDITLHNSSNLITTGGCTHTSWHLFHENLEEATFTSRSKILNYVFMVELVVETYLLMQWLYITREEYSVVSCL